MKNLSIIFLLLFAITSYNGSSQNKLKRYDVKSGIVEYVTSTSGKMMGSTISGSGTGKLFFKDWGAVELKEEQSSQTTTIKIFGRGKTKTESTHTINKLDNGESYLVDFEKKQIYANRDMAMDMTKAFQPDADAGEVGKSMLESMGGKKVGNEKFLGYNCEVWELAGGKQWIYKGVMLKLEMTTLGITTITEAKTADFEGSVPDNYFKLPDFPIQKEEGFSDNEEYKNDMEDMDANMARMSKMSYAEWKKMALENNEDLQNMSEMELRQTYDMMQKMIKAKLKN